MAKMIRWQEVISKIIEILREGPKYPDEIIERLHKKKKKRDKTVERALNTLIESGLVKKGDDGRYYFVSEREKIESLEEYLAKWMHSLRLIEGYLKTGELRYLLTNQYFRRHLETGYPDIMQQLIDWDSCLNELKNLQNEFEKILEKESERTKNSVRILRKVVKSALKLEKRTPEEIADIVSFDNLFGDIAREIKFGKGSINLKALTPEYILDLVHRVENIYKKIRELERRCENLRTMLQRYIDNLVSEVFYGALLRGYCQACPPKMGREQK